MKKAVLFLVILAIIALPVFAQNEIVFNLNAGNFGIGGNIPFNDGYSVEASITLLNFGIEHTGINTGIEFSPFKVFMWAGDEYSEDAVVYSIVNVKIYWNLINHYFTGSNLYFGPFASINTVFFRDDNYIDKYVFSAGLQLGYRAAFGGVNYNIFNVEIGYRNIDGRSRYHIGGSIDVVSLFLFTMLW